MTESSLTDTSQSKNSDILNQSSGGLNKQQAASPSSVIPDVEHPLRPVVNKNSVHYVTLSAIAGGIAGCCAKTIIAPLDRIKILFQTSNPAFKEFSSSYFGLFKAAKKLWLNDGVYGFFQGHSVTLFRIFPYAAIKFAVYEQVRRMLIPNDSYETNLRRLLAGSISGVISVYGTYPLDLLRVRLAFEVKNTSTDIASKSQSPSLTNTKPFFNGKLISTAKSILSETPKYQLVQDVSTGKFSFYCHTKTMQLASTMLNTSGHQLLSDKVLPNKTFSTQFVNSFLGMTNFYRGFIPTILGMIPYAGVSFWTHDIVHDMFRSKLLRKYAVDEELLNSANQGNNERRKKQNRNSRNSHDHSNTTVIHRKPLKAWAQLVAGGIAGLASQTAAYPFEVIRRRLQVGAVTNNGKYYTISEMARIIYSERGIRGFYTGLSIGYIKVVPMVACSFFVYERMKYFLGI